MPDCIVLDTNTWSWVPGLRPLRNPRSHSTVIASALGVYIIGGTSSPYTSEFLPWTTTAAAGTAGATGPVEGTTGAEGSGAEGSEAEGPGAEGSEEEGSGADGSGG